MNVNRFFETLVKLYAEQHDVSVASLKVYEK